MIIKKMLCFSLVSLVLGYGLICSTADAAEDYVKLIGAGASFPAPLYSKWFKDYYGLHPNVQVDYQSVGSGSGIKNFINKTVDFGASDAGMKPEEIAQVDVGVQLLPMTAGAIVLSYNMEGVPELKLSREAYAGIFLGKVTKWNDPLIAKANPDVKLPDSAINVVVRADSSGTTFVFSQHLAAISPEFAKSPGVNMMPNWAVGTRSKGNEGITASLRTTPGSIGYIEYGYAKGQHLPMAALENKAGKFVKASTPSAQASLAAVEMPSDLMAWLPDPTGDDSYPIVTYTWLLCYKRYGDANKLKALKGVIEYGLTEGQKSSEQFGYVPLPAPVVAKVKEALNNIQVK
ncbi:MAG: phosphate ABC transporter substrate-binding protein PstS [Syntrophobacteraceae bacterium]|jgi:phosphate transport system substrate-binding protein